MTARMADALPAPPDVRLGSLGRAARGGVLARAWPRWLAPLGGKISSSRRKEPDDPREAIPEKPVLGSKPGPDARARKTPSASRRPLPLREGCPPTGGIEAV